MKILIIPTVRELYKNQLEYCLDSKLIKFIRSIFPDAKIYIYLEDKNTKYDLIILAGGNSLISQNYADKERYKISTSIYEKSIKNKTKILGICYGAQFLAKELGFKIKKKKHVGNHKVNFNINKFRFNKVVNSYHNDVIELKKNKDVNIFGIAQDKTIEAFHVKSKNLLAIMWHPERYSKFKGFDKKLIKKFYATNCFISW
jgi:gamma-glutamyl-gamma-aminobutyrate hydrolase PuuD